MYVSEALNELGHNLLLSKSLFSAGEAEEPEMIWW